MRERETEGEGERERENSKSNSKTLFYKGCSREGGGEKGTKNEILRNNLLQP